MDNLVLIIKIAYYLLFVLALFLYAKYKYKKDETKKFGIVALVIFAVLFGIYGIICGPPGESIGDRANYLYRFEDPFFESRVKADSFGLYVIEMFLHLFTTNGSVLFFTISVLFFCINIYCYKKLKSATPMYLLLFFLCTLGLYGFYALKQAMSLAFMNLALTKYFQDKKIFAIGFLVVAILFHEAAWIVVPCFALAKFCDGHKSRQTFILVCMIALAVLFPLISNVFVSIFGHIPGMEKQLSQYVDESGSILIDINMLTVVKSLPYYIITIVAILYREKFKDKIENYDFLLMLSVFCSAFSILSMYMYWMFRFALYFYVPCFILATQIVLQLQGRNRKIFKVAVVGTLLVLMVKLLIQYYFIYGGIV